MALLPVKDPPGVIILCNGTRMGQVSKFEIKIRRKFELVEACGSLYPVAYLPCATDYYIKLKRLFVEVDNLTYEDLAALSNFTLHIRSFSKTETFNSCNWVELDTQVPVSGECLQSVYIIARERIVS